MATLSVLRFSTVAGASAALSATQGMRHGERFSPRDLAILSWEPGRAVPDFQALRDPVPRAPMAAAFWNLLYSHLFHVPLAAASAGLPGRDALCSLAGLGIRDDFLQTLLHRLTPGTSALFVLTDDATVDRILLLLEDLDFTVASTNLSTLQVEALQKGFGAGPMADGECNDPLPGPPARGPRPFSP